MEVFDHLGAGELVEVINVELQGSGDVTGDLELRRPRDPGWSHSGHHQLAAYLKE